LPWSHLIPSTREGRFTRTHARSAGQRNRELLCVRLTVERPWWRHDGPISKDPGSIVGVLCWASQPGRIGGMGVRHNVSAAPCCWLVSRSRGFSPSQWSSKRCILNTDRSSCPPFHSSDQGPGAPSPLPPTPGPSSLRCRGRQTIAQPDAGSPMGQDHRSSCSGAIFSGTV
jgi:hypothetical protein